MNNLQKFNQTLEDFSQEVEQFKDVSEAYKKLQRLTEIYGEITKQFEKNNKTLGELNELQKVQQEKFAKLIEEKTDQIRKENKEFYKDLEGTIKIKLDESKSQIKQLIESERNQIKQIFEIEFAKNTKELKQVIRAETKTTKILLWILGGLTVILTALSVLKLWVM